LPNRETPFFESPYYETSDKGELGSIFEGRTKKCLAIKRPNYIGKTEVPSRTLQDLPDAKLIAVLRNPIEMAIPAYFHNIKYGFLSPFDIAVDMRQIAPRPLILFKIQKRVRDHIVWFLLQISY